MTELRQVIDKMGNNFSEIVKKIPEYIDEKDPEKKKSLKALMLEIAAAFGASAILEVGGEVKGAAAQTQQS